MKRWTFTLLIVLGLGAVVAIVGFYQINIDALQEPGQIETILATRAKHLLVHRSSSRDNISSAPTDRQLSIEEGDKLYGIECAMCHGADGHTPTDSGRWMYPRASNLTSFEVQQYSDRDLFWIIKNGIRLSGMPAFGKVESDEHVWNLAHFVKTLRGSVPPQNDGAASDWREMTAEWAGFSGFKPDS
jgi:mono/diheme cytochrome c family protein